MKGVKWLEVDGIEREFMVIVKKLPFVDGSREQALIFRCIDLAEENNDVNFTGDVATFSDADNAFNYFDALDPRLVNILRLGIEYKETSVVIQASLRLHSEHLTLLRVNKGEDEL